MKTKNKVNETGVSRQQLLGRRNSISTSAKRDILVLQPFGITTEFLANLEAKAKEFETVKSHAEVLREQKELTASRNYKIDEFIEANNILRSQLCLFNGIDGTITYSVLNRSLNPWDIDGLINTGEDTLQLMKASLAEIATYGVNQARVDIYSTLLDELRNIHYAQVYKMSTVDNETTDRTALKAELYKMIYFLSNVGKAYWLKKDKARYGDYVLNKKASPPTSLKATTEQEPATTAFSSF